MLEQLSHSVHLSLCFLPLRLTLAVLKQSAAGVKSVSGALRVAFYLHAAQRNEKTSVACGVDKSGEAAVVAAFSRLVLQNEVACCSLRHTAYRRSRVQSVDEIAEMFRVVEAETDVGAQMNEVAGTHGVGSVYGEIVAELLHTLREVRLNAALFLNVFRAPVDIVLSYSATFHVEVEVCAAQTHCSCECHRVHCTIGAADERFWCGDNPCSATLG